MNRWICKDLYDFELLNAFQIWRRLMTYNVFHELRKFRIAEMSDGSFRINVLNEDGYRLGDRWFGRFSPREYGSHEIKPLFRAGRFRGKPYPEKYFYSNGSSARKDPESFGWF